MFGISHPFALFSGFGSSSRYVISQMLRFSVSSLWGDSPSLPPPPPIASKAVAVAMTTQSSAARDVPLSCSNIQPMKQSPSECAHLLGLPPSTGFPRSSLHPAGVPDGCPPPAPPGFAPGPQETLLLCGDGAPGVRPGSELTARRGL